jgi:outer membrane protein assembly factor BamB
VLKFDSTQGTWSEVTPMPAASYIFAACAVGSDIYVFGGCDERHRAQTSVFKFDTEADKWTTLAPMSRASSGHTATVMDGLVYIVGVGNSERAVLCFDPLSGAWNTLESTSSSSRKFGASFVANGCLYVAGGAGRNSSVERYDVASDTWTAVADMLEGRRYFSAITIGSAGPAEVQDLFDSLIAKAEAQGLHAYVTPMSSANTSPRGRQLQLPVGLNPTGHW